jgi:LPS O-antigen subunit length determinant protein (WzzB/FepE family)
METIEDVIKKTAELPEDLQKEVADFVDFLSQRRVRPMRNKLRFDWVGALSDLKNKYTSVELQHMASEWRIGKALTRH